MVPAQKTLVKPVVFVGKGLHSGRIVRMEVHPTSANYGIRFLRTDTDSAEIIPALYSNITATDLCTTIGSGRNSVATIEHLMAAFAGMGIDNALVRLNGPEVPIMDGSAKPFVEEFARVGVLELSAPKRLLVVKETFEFESNGRYIKIEPARDTIYRCEIDFGKSFIGQQKLELRVTQNSFMELCDARTFCHVNEVNALRSIGLAQGGSLENAVVVTDTGILNEEGLRGDNEFVRHKMLDCIGDLYLLGAPLIGKVSVRKSGHGFHAEVMNKLMLQRSRYLTVIEPSGIEHTQDSQEDLALVGGVVFG